MYLFYADESGNTGLNLASPEQPIHWIVAVGIVDARIRALEAGALAIAWRTFPDRARASDFEFHGADIFHGRGECEFLSPAERIHLYNDVLALLRQHDCTLFLVAIHKANHQQRAQIRGYAPLHPHKLGFTFLLEHIDQWLESRQPHRDLFGAPGADHLYGLVVADEQKEVDRDIVARFASWRSSGTDFPTGHELRWLVDTIHYVPSQDSWLIQLSDCVAFLRARLERLILGKGHDEAVYSESERAVTGLWRQHCADLVASAYHWP
jgi:hypothetical protein